MGSLAPIIAGTFAGEMVWTMTDYTISDIEKHIDTMEIVHRNKFVTKGSGFEATKHVAQKTSGDVMLVDIQLRLVSDLSRDMWQRLVALASAINGAGMQIDFTDDWWSNYLYHGRWVNALDFAESSTLLGSGSIMLSCWEMDAI